MPGNERRERRDWDGCVTEDDDDGVQRVEDIISLLDKETKTPKPIRDAAAAPATCLFVKVIAPLRILLRVRASPCPEYRNYFYCEIPWPQDGHYL